MELALRDAKGVLEVSEATFGREFNEALVHQVVVVIGHGGAVTRPFGIVFLGACLVLVASASRVFWGEPLPPTRVAGVADVADQLAAPDAGSHRRRVPGLVGVTRLQTAAVVDAGEVAVPTALGLGGGDDDGAEAG